MSNPKAEEGRELEDILSSEKEGVGSFFRRLPGNVLKGFRVPFVIRTAADELEEEMDHINAAGGDQFVSRLLSVTSKYALGTTTHGGLVFYGLRKAYDTGHLGTVALVYGTLLAAGNLWDHYKHQTPQD